MSKFVVITPTEYFAAKKAAADAGKQFYKIDLPKNPRQNGSKNVTYYDEQLYINGAYVMNPRLKAINLTTTNNVQKHNDPKRKYNGCTPQIRKSSTSTGKGDVAEPFGEALFDWSKLFEAEAAALIASGAIYAKLNKNIKSSLQEGFETEENGRRTEKKMDDPIIRLGIEFASEVGQAPKLTATPRGDFKMVDPKTRKLVPLAYEGAPFTYGNMHELLRYGTSISGNFGSKISESSQGVSRKITLVGAIITPGIPQSVENNFDNDELSAILGAVPEAPAETPKKKEAEEDEEEEDDDLDGLGQTYGAD